MRHSRRRDTTYLNLHCVRRSAGPPSIDHIGRPALSETVLIADDHPLFRQALSLAVAGARPHARILEAGTIPHASRIAAETTDLVLILLDLKMPGANGYSGVALLHSEQPHVPILVISNADHGQTLREARRFGAKGCLGKDADLSTIEAAISAALDESAEAEQYTDEPEMTDTDREIDAIASLTPTQLKVLLGVANGCYNKEIAYDLGVSEATVRAHMTAVLRKLNVTSRTQAALAARAVGLVP